MGPTLANPARSSYGGRVTSDPSLVRRVSRLENETESIYELIDAFRAETRGRLDGVDARLAAIDARFDGVDGRFDAIDTTLREVVRRLPEPS